MTTTTVLADDLGFPEAPRWHDGQLRFSDFHDRVVRRLAPDGELSVALEQDDSPSGLGWLPGGDLLVVSMVQRVVDGRPRLHADLSGVTRFRANDLVVDAAGRAWVSSFGSDLEAGAEPEPTVLVRVDPDGSVSGAAEGVVFPTGWC
ncbi:SMP-30/gluconolactonase/LRE family protein [Blastococcus sp. HT6-30]|uniref:SMP-30/gluconolactonase/LRE family protein n=1 Tax=Blastococcus sp. HT6-30 TaxID=3144843 RepID=UPI00321961DA